MFPLTMSPIDYQLTIHYHNYESRYGHGKFLLDFDKAGMDMCVSAVMSNFIVHYGYERIEKWLEDMLIRTMAA